MGRCGANWHGRLSDSVLMKGQARRWLAGKKELAPERDKMGVAS